MKIVLITGILSNLGKGLCCSSLASLLQSYALNLSALKWDGYLNQSSGTIAPPQHGEVFLTSDGNECDLDLGSYERFLHVNLTAQHSLTTGKLYSSLFRKEQEGKFLGQTIQINPHLLNEIQEWIETVAQIPVHKGQNHNKPDVLCIELGGTINDDENVHMISALSRMRLQLKPSSFVHIHVTLIPTVGDEPKSKLAQLACQDLRSFGIPPDFLYCRSQQSSSMSTEFRQKLSSFCNVPVENIINAFDSTNIYRVPQNLFNQNLPQMVLKALNIEREEKQRDPKVLDMWNAYSENLDSKTLPVVKIGMVGKYKGVDCYISIVRALEHAAVHCNVRVELIWIESEKIESKDEFTAEQVIGVHGLLVLPGFGQRGTEGKIWCVQYAREHKIPFFGICLGFQLVVIEAARNLLNLSDAQSEEFDPNSKHKVVIYMPEIDRNTMAQNMRLGTRSMKVQPNTLVSRIYHGVELIQERYRHRYEFNSAEYKEVLESKGYVFSAVDVNEPDRRMECVELSPEMKHPFFVGVQFHPEFQSRPARPAPCFVSFLKAAIERKSLPSIHQMSHNNDEKDSDPQSKRPKINSDDNRSAVDLRKCMHCLSIFQPDNKDNHFCSLPCLKVKCYYQTGEHDWDWIRETFPVERKKKIKKSS
jgi:CTP synthase